ncbi:MAG: translation initiation factor IF-2 [Oligoflexia bacterium]|nr:translation initiation factor IF-2 [Oligoflexia bacterium]
MPKKIFELANEIAVGALELVEKLKSLGFNVRNHMSTLSDEEISKFLSLQKSGKGSTGKSSSSDVKKKTSKKRTTPVATAPDNVKKVVQTTASTDAVAEKSDAESGTSSSNSNKGSIIKRKAIVRKKGIEPSADSVHIHHEEDETYRIGEEGHIPNDPQYASSGPTTNTTDDYSSSSSSAGSDTEQQSQSASTEQLEQHEQDDGEQIEGQPGDELSPPEITPVYPDDAETSKISQHRQSTANVAETDTVPLDHQTNIAPHEKEMLYSNDSITPPPPERPSSTHSTSTAKGNKGDDKGHEEDRPRGLRVVYRPPTPPPSPVEESAKPIENTEMAAATEGAEVPTSGSATKTGAENGGPDSRKVYYEEKMHSFTPVYIPPKKVTPPEKGNEQLGTTTGQNKITISLRTGRSSSTTSGSGATISGPGQAQLSSSKLRTNKRQMTAIDGKGSKPNDPTQPVKKKEGITVTPASSHPTVITVGGGERPETGAALPTIRPKSKVRDIGQLRADEELKSYTTELIGKVVYTPVGRKKIYLGPTKETKITAVKNSKRVITVDSGVTASTLAAKLAVKFELLKDRCLDLNLLLKEDDFLGVSLLGEIAALYQYRVEDISFNEEKILGKATTKADQESLMSTTDTPKERIEGQVPTTVVPPQTDLDATGDTTAMKSAASADLSADTSVDLPTGKPVGKSKKGTDTSKGKIGIKPRPPVVTIMGHVDHGKTTLLDYIRKSKVAQGEAGGITQHIAAYQVECNQQIITFIDTPGHAAFGAMRERGAKITDIVILVVAADDGVMPQTKESIKFCKDSQVPIIVAINKIDKEGVNTDRIKNDLLEFGLTPEAWGGETQYVEVSGLKGMGIDSLLEAILLQSEIMELTSDPQENLVGTVLESRMEAGKGAMVTTLIKSGTLKKGDYVVAGENSGRVRSLLDHTGKNIDSAGASTPVVILGIDGTPRPGERLNVVKGDREAKKIVLSRVNSRKELLNLAKPKVSLEDFLSSGPDNGENKKVLKLIVRSDVHGSYEAIKGALLNLGNQEVSVDLIGGGVGAVTDSDVQLAQSANAYIVGFGVGAVTTARQLSESLGVDIKTYRIIYELIDEVRLALEGLLAPEQVEKYIGRVEVRNIFNIPKIGMIAGAAVIDGKVEKGCIIRVLRDGKIIHEGKISSLKRFKEDVKEVKNGYECGISIENFEKILVNDILEAFVMEEKRRSLGGEQSKKQI